VLSAGSTKQRRRPVVVLQGGIHAGEIDGKDAGFWLLRELLEGRAAPGALGRVTLVFVPVFNVDGLERFGPNQRPNQRGPEQTGWRVTSGNYNLNRDYMKADAPEMVALLRLLHRFEPVLYVDLHVTDGAKFQHEVSVTFEPRLTGSPTLQALGQELHDALFPLLTRQGHRPVNFYPAFNTDDDPASGFSYGWPPPRFGHAYWAAHNRFGVLVETHSWKDYATRVKATYDVCEGLLREAAAHGVQWLEAAEQADEADAQRAGTQVTLLWEPAKRTTPLAFEGYAYTVEQSAVSGKRWVRYDESKPEVWHVPFAGELEPAATVQAPAFGWLVPGPQAALVAPRLAVHGITFTTLARSQTQVPVRTFRVAQPKFRATSYEGRQPVQLAGAWRDDVQDLPAGTLFIPSAQKRLVVAMHLLEPTLPDSLAAWGFFNAFLEQKEYLEDYLTEAYARTLLEDPAVKAEFEARLKEAAFATSPEARLGFFSAHHPSADVRLGLLPVYQATSAPR
jgi:hypothetical protein